MKTTKFPPGSFLEIDDLQGGRKVVLVGRDGVTYWDTIDAEKVTPLVIHPVCKPVELGSMVRFVQARGLSEVAVKIPDRLRARMDARADDALFIMRVLWVLSNELAFGSVPGDSFIDAAIAKANEQQRVAQSMHASADRYCEVG
ncbi:hypothetical protein RCH14_004457 [Massilia sp. MP_M2]|uniref:hypothetical protein n=1 Tax=Massilia sp. MP_M2 TaxID=3071713 RepID=UPI00319DAD11